MAVLTPLGDFDVDGLEEPGVFPWRDLLARAHVALGDAEAADAVLGRLERLVAARGSAWGGAHAALARAAILEARGDRSAAQAHLRGALGIVARFPAVEAALRGALGGVLRRSGKRRAAATLLDDARATLVVLDARPAVEECERELLACGVQPAPRGAGTRRSLTPQELAVADLVADGLTNREVAQRLVVSVKTVEYHLRECSPSSACAPGPRSVARWQARSPHRECASHAVRGRQPL